MPVGPKTTLTLERYTETFTGTGASSFTWRTLYKLTGVLNALSGSENIVYNKETVEVTHKFKINYPQSLTITEKDRFKTGSRYFDIHHVLDPFEQHRFLIIYLLERKEE